jgi:hypothetical protein
MLKQDLSSNIIPFPVELSKAIPKIKKSSSLIDFFKGKNVIWIRPKAHSNVFLLVTLVSAYSIGAGQDTFLNNYTIKKYLWATNRDAKKWNEFPELI